MINTTRKSDARALSRDELAGKRAEIVRLYKDNVPIMQIARLCDVSWSAVNVAIRRYEMGGKAALQPAVRGRKDGTGRALTQAQEGEIRQLIRKRRPFFFGLSKRWWDRETVAALIEQKLNIKLGDKAVGNYLGRWGISITKADQRPYDRCSKSIRTWLDENLPALEQKARECGAEVYWLLSQPIPAPEIWFSDTQPDVVAQPSGSPAKSTWRMFMTSAVNNRGKVQWIVSAGDVSVVRQLSIIKALVKNSRRQVVFFIRSDSRQFCSERFKFEVRNLNAHLASDYPRGRTFEIFP